MYNRIPLSYKIRNSSIKDFANPKSKKFKIMIIIFGVIVSILLIIYFINKRKWNNRNPIFFKSSVNVNKRVIIPGRKIYTSTVGNSFTYFFWLYVDNLKYRFGVIKNIFTKGNVGYYSEQQCPGVYIAPKSNTLEFILSTESSNQNIIEKFTLNDFPMKKWFSVGLVVENNAASIFLDGKLASSNPFGGGVIQNTGNLVLGGNSAFLTEKPDSSLSKTCKQAGYNNDSSTQTGFAGLLSSLCYFPEAKSVDFLAIKHSKGPYTSMAVVRLFRYITGYKPKLKINTEEEDVEN